MGLLVLFTNNLIYQLKLLQFIVCSLSIHQGKFFSVPVYVSPIPANTKKYHNRNATSKVSLKVFNYVFRIVSLIINNTNGNSDYLYLHSVII